MIQKMFSLLIALLIFSGGGATAAPQRSETLKFPLLDDVTVSVVLDTPNGNFAEPEAVTQILQETIDTIFEKKSRFYILPIDETSTYFQVYIEENGLSKTQYVDGAEVATADSMIKKSNLHELSKHFKTDYLVYVRVWTGAPRLTSGGVFTLRQKANVSVDFRVWSEQKSDYVYMKRNSATGKATYYSPSRSVKKGLRKAFEHIVADSSKIRAAMM